MQFKIAGQKIQCLRSKYIKPEYADKKKTLIKKGTGRSKSIYCGSVDGFEGGKVLVGYAKDEIIDITDKETAQLRTFWKKNKQKLQSAKQLKNGQNMVEKFKQGLLDMILYSEQIDFDILIDDKKDVIKLMKEFENILNDRS